MTEVLNSLDYIVNIIWAFVVYIIEERVSLPKITFSDDLSSTSTKNAPQRNEMALRKGNHYNRENKQQH